MLIAFVIAALALAVLYHAAVSGVGSSRTAARYDDAVSRAQSHLDAAAHSGAVIPGDWQGDDGGGFRWHLHVEPVARTARPGPTPAATPQALVLYNLTVWISWGGNGAARQVRLDTRQIGAAAEPR